MSRTDRAFLFIAIVVLAVASAVLMIVFREKDDAGLEGDREILVSSPEDVAPVARRRAAPARRTRPAEADADTTLPPPPRLEPTATTIIGTVTGPDGEPVEAVKIACRLYFPAGERNYGLQAEHEVEAETDTAGTYTLDVPGHGAYRLTFEHPAHAPVVRDSVRAGDSVDITLEPGTILAGVVREKETGKAVAGAKLVVRRREGRWRAKLEADEEGRFRVEGVYPEDLLVTVTSPKHLTLQDHVVDASGEAAAQTELLIERGRSIRGKVRDDRKQGVSAAVVTVGDKSASTDDLGDFVVSGLPQDALSLNVVADGFLTAYQSVNLSGSREEATIEVDLRRGGKVTGLVLDETGTALKDVMVKVFRTWDDRARYMHETGGTRFTCRTDDEGQFEITGFNTGRWNRYVIRASIEGYADTFTDVFRFANAKTTHSINVVMRSGGALGGHVYDEAGRPVAGVKLSLRPNGVSEWSSKTSQKPRVVLSDAEGRYSFDRLGAAKYRISALARGYATKYRHGLEIVGNQVNDGVDFTLAKGKPVRGRVADEAGSPIEGARIWIYSNSSWAQAVTDAGGEYEMTHLGEGPYTATARAEGYSVDRKRKIFPDGDRIDFELSHDGYVHGVVVEGEDEKPVTSFRVELQQKRTRRGREEWRTKKSKQIRDAEGRFKIHAPDGSYKLVIRSKGHIPWERESVSLSVEAEPEEEKIKLVPGGSVEGWVRNHLGEPLPYTEVYIRRIAADDSVEYVRKGRSEMDGYFFTGALESGSYEFAFRRRGVLAFHRVEQVNVYRGELTELRIDAPKPAGLNVWARDEQDQPIGNVRLTIESLGEQAVSVKRGRRRGRIRAYSPVYKTTQRLRGSAGREFKDLPAGLYRITARHHRFPRLVREVWLEEDATVDLELVLEKRNRSSR